MNYELLFRCLKNSPRNAGLSILDDFVLPKGGSQSWRGKLRATIDSTLNSGGHVLIASHIFQAHEYADLSGNDPFAAFVEEQYVGIDGSLLYEEARRLFGSYRLIGSDFKIGSDPYFVLERR